MFGKFIIVLQIVVYPVLERYILYIGVVIV